MMSRFTQAIISTSKGLIEAVKRFPLTVVCLVGATIVTCYMISLRTEPDLFIQKLMFTFGLGAFLSVAAQFCCERFRRAGRQRLLIYLAAALLIYGYYLIIASAPSIDYAVKARTIVAVVAMFCIYIWVPSFKDRDGLNNTADFNSIALTHFKAAVTSILFSAVLSAGVSSIIAAVDALLFKVNEDSYAYTMAVIWLSFATIYYLSRLPRYNSNTEEDQAFLQHAAGYPQVLKILVSYIIIPLIAVYSLVLIAYFVKILVTFKWPTGQLGPMILAYSIIGLTVLVLASHLEDAFASVYRKIFPKVLILMVIMQMVSVYIRLNAYGITEGRYYLALFAIYSLICGIILSFKPVTKNFIIALLGAGFALVSVIPPVDAFTVSRNSQISRLEHMLTADGVLVEGKIKPRPDASLELRQETTSILDYLERRNYLQYLAWLPAEMKPAVPRQYSIFTEEKMKEVFGFEPAYEAMNPGSKYFYAALDREKPFNISGYDVAVGANVYRDMPNDKKLRFEVRVRDREYTIVAERLTRQEARISVRDAAGRELAGTNLYKFARSLSGVENAPKESLGPDAMSLAVDDNGCRLKVVMQNVNITFGSGDDAGADYDILIFFGAPKDE